MSPIVPYPSAEGVVTLNQIKQLIQDEHLRPEQLFDMRDIRQSVELDDIVTGKVDHKEPDPEPGPKPEKKNYSDPAQNPFIKTD